MFAELFSGVLRTPYRFFLAAAVLAAILCLFPARVEEENVQRITAAATPAPEAIWDLPAGADLSERTASGCVIHKTLYYAPCGHSVQSREKLPAQLVGLTREALEREIAKAMPGAAVTGFSSAEIDAAVSTDIPCPLHWVLSNGESGMLTVMQNKNGEALEVVRETDVAFSQLPAQEQDAVRSGKIFDDVQALEAYLESQSS